MESNSIKMLALFFFHNQYTQPTLLQDINTPYKYVTFVFTTYFSL